MNEKESHTLDVSEDKNASPKWWTDEEEATVRRKLDWHILPWLFCVYGLAFLDRSNIGNAKTAGMDKDLHLTDEKYRLLTSIFYIAYIVFQFLLLFYLIVPANVWIALTLFTWGLASTLQATAHSWSAMMAARFFIGLAEAGFGTGIALFLSFFYPRREIGLRFAWFVTASAVSAAFAGALAYGLVQAKSSVAGWRLLFIVEGIPCCLVAILVYLFLPSEPRNCSRFLSPRQVQIAQDRLFKPPSAHAEKGWPAIKALATKGLDWSAAKSALSSPVAWLTSLQLWVVNVGYGTIPIYLPQILNSSGLSTLNSQGYSAPPYIVAFIWSLFQIYISDKLQHRAGFIFFNYTMSLVGYILLAVSHKFSVRYGATYLVAFGLFPQVSQTYIWLITNSSSEKARGVGLALLGTISQTGPLLGTLDLFPASEKPYYQRGMHVSIGLICGGIVIAIIAVTYFFWQNKKRDRLQLQTVEEDGKGLAGVVHLNKENPEHREEELKRLINVGRKGEDSPFFRYVI
ncbi:unnamed protein product [Sympodiomycopsis kandeliae]